MKEKINILKRKNGESQGVGALGAKPGFYCTLEIYRAIIILYHFS